jgi:hypothetical protein
MKNILSLLTAFLLIIGVAYTQAQLKEVEKRKQIKKIEQEKFLLPDFVTTDVICSYDTKNKARECSFKVKNNGGTFRGDLSFKVIATEKRTGGYYKEIEFAKSQINLDKGEEKIFQITGIHFTSGGVLRWPEPWNEHPYLTFIIHIDPKNEIAEGNENNNTFSQDISFPFIQVKYPNGGEVWQIGKRYVVRWDSEGVSGYVKISAEEWSVTGSGSLFRSYPISDGAPNTGQFTAYLDPSIWKKLGWYRIKVLSMDDSSIYDISDNNVLMCGVYPPIKTPRGRQLESEVRINPQHIYVAITKSGRPGRPVIRPKDRFVRMNNNAQEIFKIPPEGDLDIEFKIPMENFSCERQKATFVITLDNGDKEVRRINFLKPGLTTVEIDAVLKNRILNRPIKATITVPEWLPHDPLTFTVYLRLVQ